MFNSKFWRTSVKQGHGALHLLTTNLNKMSNSKNYDALLAEAQALTKDKIKSPNMPVGIYAQESEDLYQWCKKDKEQLLAAGIPETHFEKVNVAAGALRYAQSVWAEDLKTRQEAEQRWADEAPDAFDLRDQMLHTFRYAYRHDEAIQPSIDAIAEGDSSADMIQDLSDLSVLGTKNPEQLQAINFDMTLLDRCATLSSEMADLRAMANGEKYGSNENLLIRNRMYTLLKSYVDDIRDCGKYLFWRNKDRLKGYSSAYGRKAAKPSSMASSM